MKVLLDEQGFVTSFAYEGELVDGTEIEAPVEIEHFFEHFRAYRLKYGAAVFDNEQEEKLISEAKKADLRMRREKECYSIINRGQLWYEGVSIPQLLELRKWYQAWLNVTETMVVPDKPAWLQ